LKCSFSFWLTLICIYYAKFRKLYETESDAKF